MSKQLSAKCTETRKVQISDATSWHTLTIEESRALRGELEKAEEEATRKSAFREWWETRTHGAPVEVWNAALETAITAIEGDPFTTVKHVQALRALKEPVE